MSGSLLFDVSQWILVPGCILLIVAAGELGSQLGRWSKTSGTGAPPPLVALEGAALGLATLMISFTFSVALDRFDTRKAFVLEEANAIATTDLRARTLPAPHAADLGKLVDDYLDTRLSVLDLDHYGLRRVAPQSLAIQEELWLKAVELGILQPRSIQIGLFTEALTELFDVHEDRLTADRNHVPDAVLLLLLGLACAAVALAGYNSDTRLRVPVAIMGVLMATVITQIVDLDRPRRGLIAVNQQSLVSLTQRHEQNPELEQTNGR